MRVVVRIVLFCVAMVIGLVACQQNQDSDTNKTLADVLPLDANKPTFVFFFTDN